MEETTCSYEPNVNNETIIKFLCKGLGIGYKFLHVKRFLTQNVIVHYCMIIDINIPNTDSIYSPWTDCCVFFSEYRHLTDDLSTIKLSESLALNEVKNFLETTIKQRYKYLQEKLNEYQY